MPKIPEFLGMIPRRSSDKLPPGAAKDVVNFDISGGALVPLDVENPLNSMRTEGALTAGIPEAELGAFTGKPTAPSVDSTRRKCRPAESGHEWLSLKAYFRRTYIDGSDIFTVYEPTAFDLSYTAADISYIDGGLIIKAEFASDPTVAAYAAGVMYDDYGPIYQVVATADSTGAYGGPVAAQTFPDAIKFSMDPVFRASIPLHFSPDGVVAPQVYAHLELVDVSGPNWADQGVTYAATTSRDLEGGTVTFTFALNYIDPTQRVYKFVQTMVDSDGREGPPSDASDLIVCKPGELIALATPFQGTHTKNRLYRTEVGADRFLLIGDIDAETWEDNEQGTQAVELPVFGNYNAESSYADIADDFLPGSVIHPAQFGAAFTNDIPDTGDHIVWLSKPYELHVWPLEWTIPFQETILAIALSGGTILVFTTNKVYGLSGSNPALLSAVLLSDTSPLLSINGLARIDQTIFWPTYDGLAAFSGGGVEIVTRQHFTRNEWLDLEPASMTATTGDGSVFLEHASDSSKNLRVELGEGASSVTRWTALTGGSPAWESQTFEYPRPEVIDWIKTEASGAVDVTVVADGTETVLSSVSPDTWTATGAGAARTFSFKIAGSQTVRSFEAHERRIVEAGDIVTVDGATDPLWEDLWFHFPDRDRWVAGTIAAHTYPVTLTFKDEAGSTVYSQEVADGHLFTLPRSFMTLPNREIWRVAISSSGKIDSMTLMTRRPQGIERDIRVVHNGTMPEWLTRRYEWPDGGEVVSGIVRADSYSGLNLNLYKDGAATRSIDAISIANGYEFAVAGLGRASALEYDFGGSDYAVKEVILFNREAVPVGERGLIMRGASGKLGWRMRAVDFPTTGSFAVVRVVASDYTGMTLTLYADGTIAEVVTIANDRDVKLAVDLPNARHWIIDLAHQGEVDEMHLISRQRLETDAGEWRITRAGEPFSWMGHRVNVSRPVNYARARVLADPQSYPVTVRLFHEGTQMDEFVARDEKMFSLRKLRPERTWELDAISASNYGYIEEVALATSAQGLRGQGNG